MLSTTCSHWPLLCMKNKERHDPHIDFAIKVQTQREYLNKRSRKMRWNFLIIILTFPITFRVMNWILSRHYSLVTNATFSVHKCKLLKDTLSHLLRIEVVIFHCKYDILQCVRCKTLDMCESKVRTLVFIYATFKARRRHQRRIIGLDQYWPAFWNINTEWFLLLMRIIILLFLQSAFRLSMGPRSLTWINFS